VPATNKNKAEHLLDLYRSMARIRAFEMAAPNAGILIRPLQLP